MMPLSNKTTSHQRQMTSRASWRPCRDCTDENHLDGRIQLLYELWHKYFINVDARVRIEPSLDCLLIELLNVRGREADQLHKIASDIRNLVCGKKIHVLAVIELSNVCRGQCLCCPMRSGNLIKSQLQRLTVSEIVSAMQAAYDEGFREFLFQSGEDPKIIEPFVEALRSWSSGNSENRVKIVANLGDLRFDQYKELKVSGVETYLLYFEEANVAKHERLRPHSTFQQRAAQIGNIERAHLKFGTGFMIGGIPDQTDADIARNIRFVGECGAQATIGATCFTPGEGTPLSTSEPGDFGKTLNAIALLRLLFPDARIPVPSNSDSIKIIRHDMNEKSGLSLAVEAGANEITINCSPKNVRDRYAIFDVAHKRPIVSWAEAIRAERETQVKLYLK